MRIVQSHLDVINSHEVGLKPEMQKVQNESQTGVFTMLLVCRGLTSYASVSNILEKW